MRNDAGQTPLDIARANGFHDVLDGLVNTPLPRSHWASFDYDDSLPRESGSTTGSDTLNVSSLVTQVKRPDKPRSAAPARASAAAADNNDDGLDSLSDLDDDDDDDDDDAMYEDDIDEDDAATSAQSPSASKAAPGAASAASALAGAASSGRSRTSASAVLRLIADSQRCAPTEPLTSASPPPRTSMRLPERPGALDELFAKPGVPHRTLYDFVASRPDELTFAANQQVLVLKRFDDGWLLGEHEGLVGMFPAKYVLLETMPRHSSTAELARKAQKAQQSAQASPPQSGSATPKVHTPPVPRMPVGANTSVKPAPVAAASESAPAAAPASAMKPNLPKVLTAKAATSTSAFAQTNEAVVAANKKVSVSEDCVLSLIEAIEVRLRRSPRVVHILLTSYIHRQTISERDIKPFLDSVPTMAAAAGRAYDTALRSVQLLSQTALAVNRGGGGREPNAASVEPFVEPAKLSDTMLGATSAWIQSRQLLADEGRVRCGTEWPTAPAHRAARTAIARKGAVAAVDRERRNDAFDQERTASAGRVRTPAEQHGVEPGQGAEQRAGRRQRRAHQARRAGAHHQFCGGAPRRAARIAALASAHAARNARGRLGGVGRL